MRNTIELAHEPSPLDGCPDGFAALNFYCTIGAADDSVAVRWHGPKTAPFCIRREALLDLVEVERGTSDKDYAHRLSEILPFPVRFVSAGKDRDNRDNDMFVFERTDVPRDNARVKANETRERWIQESTALSERVSTHMKGCLCPRCTEYREADTGEDTRTRDDSEKVCDTKANDEKKFVPVERNLENEKNLRERERQIEEQKQRIEQLRVVVANTYLSSSFSGMALLPPTTLSPAKVTWFGSLKEPVKLPKSQLLDFVTRVLTLQDTPEMETKKPSSRPLDIIAAFNVLCPFAVALLDVQEIETKFEFGQRDELLTLVRVERPEPYNGARALTPEFSLSAIRDICLDIRRTRVELGNALENIKHGEGQYKRALEEHARIERKIAHNLAFLKQVDPKRDWEQDIEGKFSYTRA